MAEVMAYRRGDRSAATGTGMATGTETGDGLEAMFPLAEAPSDPNHVLAFVGEGAIIEEVEIMPVIACAPLPENVPVSPCGVDEFLTECNLNVE
ncbi:hypothetical protein HK104_005306, partial [Borealophlyctis nickersoniae]